VDTIQAILAAKTNIGLSCKACSEKLASNHEVLKETDYSDDYHALQGPLQNNQGTVK
jgi:uncharacterized Zn finger protein